MTRHRPDLARPWAPSTPEVTQLDPRLDSNEIPQCDRVRCLGRAVCEVYDRPMCEEHASWAVAGLIEDALDWGRMHAPTVELHEVLTAGRHLEQVAQEVNAASFWNRAARVLSVIKCEQPDCHTPWGTHWYVKVEVAQEAVA